MRFISVIILFMAGLAPGWAVGAAAAAPGTCQQQMQQLETRREQLAQEHTRLKTESASFATIAARLKTQGDKLEADTLKLQHEQEQIMDSGRSLDIKQPAAGRLLYEKEIAGAAQSKKIAVYNRQAKAFNQRNDAHNAQITAYNLELSAQQQQVDQHNAATKTYNENLHELRAALAAHKQRCRSINQ